MSAAGEFIQFNPVQLSGTVPEDTTALREACATLAARDLHTSYTGTHLIGSNGNVSVRRAPGFVITATQLPSKENLAPEDCVHLETCAGGEARFHGPKLPSSESILHWHLFETFTAIQAIVHVHESNALLYSESNRARWPELGIVESTRDIGGGTLQVGQATAETFTTESDYVILKNHRPNWDLGRTGTVVLGRTLEEALERTLKVHEALK
ncbi:MAG: class II aldolase/adducin family protein [Verrucomicrobia subdivision 3 bacterium]|nr:class II aldolase/adducin family protein [Limisphaerales bacterium]